MGKHHHHHGGHGRRGFRRFRGGDVLLDYGPDVFEPACFISINPQSGVAAWTCPPYEAGHIPFDDTMGIFGSTDAQKTAVSAEDGNWTALMAAMIAALTAGKVNSAYTNAFTDKRAGWSIFKDSVLRGASMSEDEFTSQLDAWKSERSAWAQDLEKKTGVALPIISAAPPPKQENPDSFSNLLGKSTGLILAGALLAGILVFGRGSHRYAY